MACAGVTVETKQCLTNVLRRVTKCAVRECLWPELRALTDWLWLLHYSSRLCVRV